MQRTKEDFLKSIQKLAGIHPSNTSLIAHAWDFAQKKHHGVLRATGQDYFVHPIGVALILAKYTIIDVDTISAALLHDVVEDTDVSIEEIREEFGVTIGKLVDGVTKLSPLDTIPEVNWTKEKERLANLRKLFVSIVSDPRVAIIKIADRVHNLESLGVFPETKKRRIAEESLQVYAPLAEALGLGLLQSRIQDLAFRYWEPVAYQEIRKRIHERQLEFDEIEKIVVSELEDLLEKSEVNINYVYSRQKEPYSIYRKMKDLDLDLDEFDEVYDIIGVRIIAETIDDCFQTKTLIDQLYEEVRYDDYITRPREPLGYQSLHKLVRDSPGGYYIEIQIRTPEMHKECEKGSAAHWIYKLRDDPSSTETPFIRNIKALRDSLSMLDEDEFDVEGFIQALREDGLKERIRVLSPNRDVISLPVGSTPIDFAYHIHTNLGHECRAAKVNGRPVKLDYCLNDGDVVEIIRHRGGKPSINWLYEEKVVSNRAKQKIRNFLRNQDQTGVIARGKKLVSKRIKSLRNLAVNVDEITEYAFKQGIIPDQDNNKLYLAIGENRLAYEKLSRIIGKISFSKYINSVNLSEEKVASALPQFSSWLFSQNIILDERESTFFQALGEQAFDTRDVLNSLNKFVSEYERNDPNLWNIDANTKRDPKSTGKGLLISVAKCCYPIPGDEIVGYVTKGKGIVVHRKICSSVLGPYRSKRVIDGINWNDLNEQFYSAELFLELNEATTLAYSDIQNAVRNNKGVIREMKLIGNPKKYLSHVQMLIDVNDKEQLVLIIRSIKNCQEITDVKRRLEI